MARKTRTPRKTRVTPATAFQRARTTVRKALGTLAKQGVALQAAGREAAMDRANAVRESAASARDTAIARAEEARARTVSAVNHLEKVFEQRVSRAISKMGVPTTKDVRALSRQVAQLQASVDRLNRSRSRSAA